MHETATTAAKSDDREPTYRRKAPKLPPGASFTPTHLVTKNDEGTWVNRRLVAVNEDRRDRRASGLTPKQIKRLRRAERVEATMRALEDAAKAAAMPSSVEVGA